MKNKKNELLLGLIVQHSFSANVLSCATQLHQTMLWRAVKSNCTSRMMDVCMDLIAQRYRNMTPQHCRPVWWPQQTLNSQRYKTHSDGSLNFINIFWKCKLRWEESNLEDPTALEYKGKNVYPFRMWYSQKGKHWERICSSALNQSPHLY